MHNKISQLIIGLFLVVLLGIGFYLKLDMKVIFNESIFKFLMNGVMVLSLIPMINCGLGINFGLPIGLTSGLLGMCISINMRLTGVVGFVVALVATVIFGYVLGELYGRVLNMAKGREEITGTFLGFSFVFFMNFIWTLIPFKNREMLYPLGGKGLRPKISLNNYFYKVLDHSLNITIKGFNIPLGGILFYVIICLFIYLFFKSKKGKVMMAVGENEKFSKSVGIKIESIKKQSIIVSTIIAGFGMCVYSQSYGIVELYNAPMMMAFPAASAILIGGACKKRVRILDAIVGTYLFQTIFLISAPIANQLLFSQASEIFRVLISNLIILFALLKSREVRNG